ncbi:MAG: FG-GAP repeat protein, partial [Acidobacteriota bacterium]
MITVAATAGLAVPTADAQLVAANRTFFPGNEPGDRLGAAMAVGDFNGDGYDDLAVGVPDEDFGSGVDRAGQVRTYLGGPGGISDESALSAVFFESELLGGEIGAGHRFGAALAAADFDLDGFDDLAIGIPGQTVDGEINAGAVAVVWGGLPTGIDRSRALFFDQSVLTGSAEAGDQFGASLAAGRLGNEEHP